MRRRHVLAALVAAAALGPVTPSASAHPLGDRVITIPIPDLANPLHAPCDTSFYLGGWPYFSTPSTVHEPIDLRVESSTEWCDDVAWETRVTIVDDSPGHATRTVSDSDGAGNPSWALTGQVVPYGLGVREVGLVTYQFEAKSSIFDFCARDLYVVDSLLRTVTWVPNAGAC